MSEQFPVALYISVEKNKQTLNMHKLNSNYNKNI